MKHPSQINTTLYALSGFLLFLSVLQSVVSAQTLNFKGLTIDDGLNSSNVYDITEDQNGFIWITDDKGLSRFDGSEFVNVDSRDGYTGRGAYRIFKSSANELFVITVDFKLFLIKDGRCRQIRLPFDVAWIIENDSHQITGISRRGIVFRLSDGKNTHDTLFDARPKIGSTNYYNICYVTRGRFIVTSSEGINEINVERNQQTILIPNQPAGTFRPQRIFKTIDGEIYAFSLYGLYQLFLRQDGGYDIRLLKKTNGEEIISMYKDAQSGDLWIGTSNGLLQWREGKNGITETTYLNDIPCYNVFMSKEHILWCTTAENGLFFSNVSSVHFTKEVGLKNDHISFLHKNGHTIYAITKDGKIVLIENQKIVQNWNLKDREQFSAINCVANCTDGIYVVINQNRFIRISDKSLSAIVTPEGSFPLFDNNTYFLSYKGAAYRTNPLRFWYRGGMKGDLYKLSAKDRLGNGFIRNIRDSVLLYATRKGFLVIHVDNPDSIDYHIINTPVSSMVETKKGSWFFSTPDKGLYIEWYDGKKGFYGKNKMLLSDYCSKVYYHNGEVWAATNGGISRLILNHNDSIVKVVNYTGQDRLISREVNDILFDEGYVYVATNKGVSFFKEEIPSYTNASPIVFLDRIQINNKDTSIQSSYVLPFTQNNITITYNSPSFRSARNMLYRYAIIGKKVRTIYGVSASKILQLGSLAPDEYVVCIWARNIDGQWSITPARLTITIMQPFWRRIEFLITVGAVVLLIILLLVIRRINQQRERNRVQALLLDSELKALRLHMNPHFIFNTLNSLQKFILERDPIEANKYIAKFSRLMRWIMVYSDRHHLSLEEEFLFLDTYIELEQLRFDTVFKVEKNIDPRLIPSMVFISALVIQPFVENAIKYGITGIAYQGSLLITVEKYEDYLMVVVQDNGIGRAAVGEEQYFSGKEFESTGIKYTNERLLLLLESKLNIKNAVKVIDLYAENGIAAGTRVELIIPYHNE